MLQGAQRIERVTAAFRELVPRAGQEQPTLLDLNHLVDGCTTLLANTILKATDSLRVNPGHGLPAVRGRGPLISHVFLQVIVNVCRSIHNRTQTLEITTRREQDGVACHFELEGAVMPHESVARIQAFLDGSGPNPGYEYPGLEAIRQIMIEHGGNMRVFSKEKTGTRIALRFPASG
jgi:K+-sensing histidine kinase KdpD